MKTKRFIYSLLVFFIIPSILFGNDKDSNKIQPSSYISINGGLGIPGGKDYVNLFNTYALDGPNINVSALIPINHSNFCIAGMIGYGSNAFDLTTYLHGVGVFPTTLSGGHYDTYIAMPGVSLIIPIKFISVDLHFLGGVLYFITPKSIYTEENTLKVSPVIYTSVTNPESTLSFAADIGISIKCKFTKIFFGSLSADFIYSGFSGGFNSAAQNSNSVFYNQENYLSTFYTITIGVGYKL